ncbi:MAG: gliding motility-associated C-terminal domain-containing protein [Williamsia sp.]|nr:gliding motility-associated C-terminal domain-containing protein [Williamsia sp.]
MKSLLLRLSVFGACLLAALSSFSQDFTNKGKDFWVAYGNHVRMFSSISNSTPAEKMQLYMTSDVNTSGTVDIPGISTSLSFTVTANQITTLDIPRAAALLDEGVYNLGIHIKALKPVVVYSFIYVNSISGATLCLPVNTLGRDYYSINYTQISNETNSYSYFDVIATDTGTTTVEITPSQATKGGHAAGIPYMISLTQGQIYQALGVSTSSGSANRGVDLTGSRIRSISTGIGTCKKIAVFCGSGKISIGCAPNAGTSDNLYQQMYPLSTWGKTYLTVPSVNKASSVNQNNIYRIFKSDPSATVKLDGTVINGNLYTNNQYYEFNSQNPAYIESDKPILVAQYLTTSGCSGNTGQGDPEMIYLNPVEQTISSVTLNSMQPAANTNINEHHINVVCRNAPEITGSFRIDGVLTGGFKPLATNTAYAYAQLTVTQGTHTLSCDSGFNAIAYGFGSAESYGYSAGTNLKDLYQFVSVQNQYATVSFPAACRNSPFKFSMTLPYKPLSLKWVFNGLFTDTIVYNPVVDSSWTVNDRVLYRFKLDRFYTISSIATYPITIFANNPTSDGCSGEQEISYDLQIFERPQAAFTGSLPQCLGDTMKLVDTTNGNGRAVVKWTWDFGDGSSSTLKNPSHVYRTAGSYKLNFNAITDVGCLSDTISKVVTLTELPVAAFTTANAVCEKTPVQFKDGSTPANGDITKWNWNFGDGSTATTQSPVHTFAQGSSTVSLQVETKTGCKSSVSQALAVNYQPHPRFGLPEICLNDASATFTDSSTIANNSQGGFRYRWQFGDAAATAANPDTSLLRNPSHKYTATGNYRVTLQVTTAAGCVADTTQLFTVNGAVPKADLVVKSPDQLCSNAAVELTDKAGVDFGKITRVEIYWDYGNDPALKTVDDNPVAGATYKHLYPAFGMPVSKTVQVAYKVFSGISCSDQVVKTITLLARPVLKTDSIPPVCADKPSFRIAAMQEINGLTGSGVYAGTGISPDGTFTPAIAKAGTKVIAYTFTTTAGCKTTDSNTVIVYPVPLVNAGPDKSVLEGGSVTLDATATLGSTFTWTPSLYLDNSRSLTPKVTPVDSITYRLDVTSANGCIASDQVSVTVLKDLKVPNAFSPNGDGINDTWKIPYLSSYQGATIEVFNRYGQKVFSSSNYNREWNGTYNGNPLPVGTYYWIIDPKNGRKQINGSVSIIR